MGNNVVKGVLVAALLIVLSFWIGISAADDVRSSAIIIASVCGVVGALCIGKNAWLLIFYAVLVLAYTALPLLGMRGQMGSHLLMIGVFIYFLTLKFTTHLKFGWRSIILLDLCVYVLFALLLYAFYRQPSIAGKLASLFNIRVDVVGGKEYVYGLVALLGYLAMNAIPVSLSQLEKHVKPIILLALCFIVLNTIVGIIAPGSVRVEGDNVIMGQRYSAVFELSSFVLAYIVATKKLTHIITKVRYMLTSTLCLFGVLLAGSRSKFAGFGVLCVVILWAKRELHIFFCVLVLGFACLYGVSEMGILKKIPFGVQRSLNPIPGLKLGGEASINANGSTEYRMRIWEYALDTRTGFIKDYVWGDGYGASANHIKKLNYAIGTQNFGVMEHAMARNWHFGPITMIHGLGVVGLLVQVCISILSAYYGFVVLRAYWLHKLFPYVALTVAKLYTHILLNFAVCNSFVDIFTTDIVYIALIKVFYCEGVKDGIVAPMMKKSAYVPLAVQERQKEEPAVPEYPLPSKLKKLQNEQA